MKPLTEHICKWHEQSDRKPEDAGAIHLFYAQSMVIGHIRQEERS